MNAKIFLIAILIVFIFIPVVSAFSDEPINVSDKELQEILKKDDPNEIPISFWDLPLWIKIHYVITTVLCIIGVWKFLPILITKLKSALENAKRRKILKIIMKNQGISVAELEAITKENRSTLRYHLSMLEDEGWIKTVKFGKNRLIFLNTGDIDLTGVVKGRKREIVEILKENGDLTSSQIAERLKLNVKTVYYHLNDLMELGIVTKCENGKYKLV
jgi:predicted transcriptional regulator